MSTSHPRFTARIDGSPEVIFDLMADMPQTALARRLNPKNVLPARLAGVKLSRRLARITGSCDSQIRRYPQLRNCTGGHREHHHGRLPLESHRFFPS